MTGDDAGTQAMAGTGAMMTAGVLRMITLMMVMVLMMTVVVMAMSMLIGISNIPLDLLAFCNCSPFVLISFCHNMLGSHSKVCIQFGILALSAQCPAEAGFAKEQTSRFCICSLSPCLYLI